MALGLQKKEAVPDDSFCDVDQQPNMVTVSHHVSPEMKSTSPTPEELEEHYRSVTSQRLKETRNLGAWAKPLHFTSPATPRDDNAQLGPNKASWPSLSDGSRAKTRRQQQDGKTPVPMNKLPPPLLKPDGSYRFPWATKMDPAKEIFSEMQILHSALMGLRR